MKTKRVQTRIRTATALLAAICSGCTAPQYAIRNAPAPVESQRTLEIEQAISDIQARELEKQGTRRIASDDRPWGFPVQQIVRQISQVTERPYLPYLATLLQSDDPNAVALADGRIYITTGMLRYLYERKASHDELSFVIAHELAHTVAQHLAKRYDELQRQALIISMVQLGASALSSSNSSILAQTGQLTNDLLPLLQQVAFNGYSQDQELEADQLAIGYMQKAGFDPKAALNLLEDFKRFDHPGVFLSTHPYSETRKAYLEQFLYDIGRRNTYSNTDSQQSAPQRYDPKFLRTIQKTYPVGSQSWKNLQRQIEELEKD